MDQIVTILIGSIFVNNFAMSRFLGICPFLGVSKKLDSAFGMGMAVTFVMAMASLVAYMINAFLLVPFGLEYLQTIAFILVIAVLGVTQLNVTEGYNLILSVVNGAASALGFTLAICLFAGIRERLAVSNMPKWMDGFVGALLTAGLMAVAFNGFSGLI